MAQVKNSVVAVIVTYNSSDDFLHGYKVVQEQVESVVIIDNNSSTTTVKMLSQLSHGTQVPHIIHNRENRGLAAAQNQGIAYALQEGHSWVLLLDDDSLPAPNMVEELLAVAQNSPIAHTVITTPQTVDKNSGVFHKVVYKTSSKQLRVGRVSEITSLYCALSSGMLISSYYLRKAGGMKEELFIDEIDTEYCLRALALKHAVVIAPKALLYHQIGQSLSHQFLWRRVTSWNHSKERKFYIFRNRIWVWRHFWRTAPRYVLYEIGSTCRLLLLIILFEKQRVSKLRSITKALWEGLWMK